MKKNFVIVIFGSLIFWLAIFLIHELFKNINVSFRYLEILLGLFVAPFLLGFSVSQIIKGKNTWIYGGLSYVIYFILFNIFVFIFEFSFHEFSKHLLNIFKVYFYTGSIATLFAVFGGLLGEYIRKKKFT